MAASLRRERVVYRWQLRGGKAAAEFNITEIITLSLWTSGRIFGPGAQICLNQEVSQLQESKKHRLSIGI